MRVAAIDCGTNSVRLLLADVTDDRLTDVATMRTRAAPDAAMRSA